MSKIIYIDKEGSQVSFEGEMNISLSITNSDDFQVQRFIKINEKSVLIEDVPQALDEPELIIPEQKQGIEIENKFGVLKLLSAQTGERK